MISRTLTFGDRDVTVRELRVDDLRQVIAEYSDAAPARTVSESLTLALALLPDPADQQALMQLERMTDVPLEAVGSLTPTELQVIATACREVNGGFFGLLARLAAANAPPSPT